MGLRTPSSAAVERVRGGRAACVALAFSTGDRVLQRKNFDANRRQLARLSALFFAAMVLFVADLVLWLSMLAT